MSKKIKDEELEAPVMPGEIDRSAVTAAGKNLSMAKGILNNMSYDTFKQGSIYDGLKKSYEQQGKTAMKDVLGQVAARTGGMASSYATSAANQSYNNYMQTLEDTARAMYNEEYAKNRDKVDLAQQEYNNAYGEYRDTVGDAWTRYNAEYNAFLNDRDHNYRVSRDTKADNDAAKEDEIDMLSTDAYYGKAVSWQEYLAAHPNTQLSESDYNSIISAAIGRRTDDNRLNVDAEFESMFGAEGFDWNKYDWNGDGKVDETDSADAYDFSGSSYGADYWQQYWRDAQQGYADADTKEAQDEVMAILEAGGTPTTELLIKAGFLASDADVTDNDENGIPDSIPTGLSGLAATMWQNNIDAEIEATEKENEANQKEAQDEVMAILEAGGTPTTELLIKAGFLASDADVTDNDENGIPDSIPTGLSGLAATMWQNNIDAEIEATEKENEANQKEAQDEVMAILEAGGTPDTQLLIKAGWLTANDAVTDNNNDGIPDTIPAGLTGAARTVWQNNIDSKTAADTKEAQENAADDIKARIANGESLEDIEADYGIGATTADGDGEAATWESVTGMSKAEWQQIYNDNEIKNYHFPDTDEGRTNIVSKMLNSGTLKLSTGDQANFDYLYGNGAYDAVQDFISSITPNGMDGYVFGKSKNFHNHTQSAFEGAYNRYVDTLMEAVPSLDYLQVLEIIEKANPEMHKAVTNLDTYPFADRYS